MPAALSPQLRQRLCSLPTDSTVAWLFPGQGSQEVGMGKELCQGAAIAREIFDCADTVLGLPISRLCFEGPEGELRQTVNAQPAIFVASLACLATALERGAIERSPAFVAGHSLGEYTALVSADAIDFADALILVRERGRLMEEANQAQPGAMAALIGLDEEAVERLCQQAGTEVANRNCPGQGVVAGRPEAVQRAMALARQGGGRSVMLNVSGAFHTSLMGPAAQALAVAIDGAPIRKPRMPVVANASAQPLASAEDIREELKRQLLSPVLWQPSIEAMMAAGVHRFLEIGPGRALSGLIKRIDGTASTLNVNGLAALRRPSDDGSQR
ncbi:MAG: ACP S-malonyltransferase [Dehalococcoidia bacterium]